MTDIAQPTGDENLPTISADEATQRGFQPVPDEENLPTISADEAAKRGFTAAPDDTNLPTISADEAAQRGFKDEHPPAETPLATGVREAAHEAIPAAGSIAAMGYGAAQGAELGFAVAGPPGAVVGGVGGALITGGVAGYILQKASSLVEKALGIDDDAQREANRQANKWSAIAGGTLPWALGFRPSAQLALKTRSLMAAGMGSFSAASQYAQTGEVDPEEVAAQAAFGFVADKPTKLGQKLLNTGELFSVPLKTSRGVSESPPPPSQTADVGNDTSPPVRDEGNKGKYAKKVTPTEGSDTVTQGDLKPDELAVLQQSVAGAAIKPPTGEEGAPPPQRKPGIDVSAMERAADQMKEPTDFSEAAIPKEEVPLGEGEPISARLPSLEAQHAQDIEPATNAKAQAEALQNIKAKRAGLNEPLTPEQEAVPERPAKPAVPPEEEGGLPPNARTVQWTDPHLEGLKVETADTGNRLSRMSDDGKTLQLSAKVPESIDVAGKTLNPAEPLAIREAATMAGVDRLSGFKTWSDQQKLDYATKAAGIPSENAWLKEQGYDEAAYRKVMDSLQSGKVMPPATKAAIEAQPPSKAAQRVQARQIAEAKAAGETIPLQNKPTSVQLPNRVRPVVDLGLAEPEVKVQAAKAKAIPGKAAAQKLLDAREDMPEDTKARMQKALNEGTPAQVKQIFDQLRNKINRPLVEGTNVQASTPAEAAAKKSAVDAATSALEAFPSKANRIPDEPSEIQALRDRAQAMLDHAAQANGGVSPLDTYAPREKPAAWEVLREARNLLSKKETSPYEAREFLTNEVLARGALREDPNATNAIGTRRIESDIGFKGNPEEALPGETPYEARVRAETEVEKNLTADEQDLGKTHDLTTDKGVDQFKTDTEKLIPNLIKYLDKKATVPRWERSTQEMVTENKALLARRQQANALVSREPPGKPEQPKSGEGRAVTLTDDIVKEALASAERVMARTNKAAYIPKNEVGEVADTPTPPKKDGLAKRFIDSESGELNIKALDAYFRTRAAGLRSTLSKYLGATWNDNQRVTKSVLTQMMTHMQNLNTDMRNYLDADWHRMNEKIDEPNFYAFMDTLEKTNTYTDALSGVGPPQFNRDELISELKRRGVSDELAPYLAEKAPMTRDIMDQIFRDDKAYGSTAEYIKNYVPHIFSAKKVNGQTVEEWIQARNEARTKSLGSTTHQQERVFDTIQAATKAGFELRYNNLADLISARYAASVDFHMLVGGLRKLQEMGLASPWEEAKGFQKKWPNIGGAKYNAPDHNSWVLHPDAVPLWKNAEDARGLRDMKGPIGSVYRTWMALKNIWVPVELAFTAFHPIHVLGINFAENITGALHEGFDITHPQPLIKALKDSVAQPFLMLPFDKLPFGLGEKYAGTAMGQAQEAAKSKQMVQWWKKPADERTASENMWQGLAEAGGMLRGQPGEERIISEHALSTSLANEQYFKAVPQALRLGVQKAALGMFTHWIPDLKMAAFQNAASRAFRMDRELLTDSVKRNEVMRMIGNDIHSRYGEMNYKVLGWNPIIRDAGVGSFLSLSWQLGQVNQAAGAAHNLIMRAGGKTIQEAGRLLGDAAMEVAGKERQGTRLQQTLYKHSTKGTYVTSYVASSMMLAGAASYMLSGVPPAGVDYVYPRNGNTNPDNTVGRYTVPFNTREGPMLAGHVTASDSIIQGLKQLIYNKMIIAPIVEMAQNRDAFGNELYSVHSPAAKAALQMIDSELGRRFTPISATSAHRAQQLGGTTKDTVAAYLGFGPAPAYTEKSGMEAQVSDLYKTHGAPASRPYEVSGTGLVKGLIEGQNTAQKRQDARMAKNLAIQQHDPEGEQAANRALIATGESPTAVKKQRPGEDTTYFFSRLPISDQTYLVGEMAKDKENGAAKFKQYILQNREIHKMARGQLMQQFYKQRVNQ